MTIRVIIVDDQAMVRAGFAALLAAQSDIDVVGEAPDGRKGVEVSRSVHPDVVLMDVRMPEMDGLAAARELLSPPAGVVHRPKVLMLTTFDVDDYVYEALRAEGVRVPPQGRPARGPDLRGAGRGGRGRAARAVRDAAAHRGLRTAAALRRRPAGPRCG